MGFRCLIWPFCLSNSPPWRNIQKAGTCTPCWKKSFLLTMKTKHPDVQQIAMEKKAQVSLKLLFRIFLIMASPPPPPPPRLLAITSTWRANSWTRRLVTWSRIHEILITWLQRRVRVLDVVCAHPKGMTEIVWNEFRRNISAYILSGFVPHLNCQWFLWLLGMVLSVLWLSANILSTRAQP